MKTVKHKYLNQTDNNNQSEEYSSGEMDRARIHKTSYK